MNILTLTIVFPLISFLLLTFFHWSEKLSATFGSGSIGLAALVTAYSGMNFLNHGKQPFIVPLWTWMSVGDFKIGCNLMLDSLSLIMLSIVTGIGFLIHIFASWYMRSEEGYSRFFAYTNLFIASMNILVLADNMLVMYLGWEVVGLCSYLLIGFYYQEIRNNEAAMKAFVITRIGDVLLAFALFILYNELGVLNFQEIMDRATVHFTVENNMLWWATLMLLGGAVGKSAQLPLQTWLADAMAGPTPVSALIHAATMVTAGVYLIARTHGLFLMNSEIMYLVSMIGAITLVMASFAALLQTDLKRILAYSTMSQIGYMFLALGIQAWNAAISHMMMHAFFKALLFLSSGSVILSCHHEQNIFKMGGLRKSIPLIYVCFLVGGAALAALPLVSASFFSKEKILASAMTNGHIYLMITGLIGAFITSLYTFRMIFIIFHGKEKIHVRQGKGIAHHFPLIVLLVLSTFVGKLIEPSLQNVFPDTTKLEHSSAMTLEIVSSIVTIAGTLIAAWLWLGKRTLVTEISNSVIGRLLGSWWYNAWGFDWLYNILFVKPFLKIAYFLKSDPMNVMMNIPAFLSYFASKILRYSENGYLRWYIASMSIGAVVVLTLLMILD